jgi:hypothetical protein
MVLPQIIFFILSWRSVPMAVYKDACIAGNRKKQLYRIPQSQNNCTKIHGLIRNSVTDCEVWLGGVRPSWARQMYRVDCPYPPPHIIDHLICRESNINGVLRNNSSLHCIAVSSPSLVIHWFSLHHHLHHQQLHLPSSSYPEKE